MSATMASVEWTATKTRERVEGEGGDGVGDDGDDGDGGDDDNEDVEGDEGMDSEGLGFFSLHDQSSSAPMDLSSDSPRQGIRATGT